MDKKLSELSSNDMITLNSVLELLTIANQKGFQQGVEHKQPAEVTLVKFDALKKEMDINIDYQRREFKQNFDEIKSIVTEIKDYQKVYNARLLDCDTWINSNKLILLDENPKKIVELNTKIAELEKHQNQSKLWQAGIMGMAVAINFLLNNLGNIKSIIK